MGGSRAFCCTLGALCRDSACALDGDVGWSGGRSGGSGAERDVVGHLAGGAPPLCAILDGIIDRFIAGCRLVQRGWMEARLVAGGSRLEQGIRVADLQPTK